jgi:hypothetical protein
MKSMTATLTTRITRGRAALAAYTEAPRRFCGGRVL